MEVTWQIAGNKVLATNHMVRAYCARAVVCRPLWSAKAQRPLDKPYLISLSMNWWSSFTVWQRPVPASTSLPTYDTAEAAFLIFEIICCQTRESSRMRELVKVDF